MNMTLKEELKSWWPKLKTHGGRITVGIVILALVTGALGGLVSMLAVSYLLGMIFIKNN